jgi:hypothetical protein
LPGSKEKYTNFATPRNEETPSRRNSVAPSHSGEKRQHQAATEKPGASGSSEKRLRKMPTVQSFDSMVGSQKGGDNGMSSSFAEDMESLQE